MGWCGGSEIYIAVADFETLIDEEYHGESTVLDYFTDVIAKLEEADWDCKDEALEQLNKGTLAYRALAATMGLNPECPGKCFEIRCEGKDSCGCTCHY